MARQEVVSLECDIPGKGTRKVHDADKTLQWSFDGVDYEVDLCADELARFQRAIARFQQASRLVKVQTRVNGYGRHASSRSPAPGTRTMESRNRSREIRAWAKTHGHKLPERGRIPGTIVAEYDQAMRDQRATQGFEVDRPTVPATKFEPANA